MLEFVLTCPAMYFHQPAQRRLAVLCRILSHSQVIQPNAVSAISVRYSSDQKSISIGDVTKLIKPPKYPQYVPRLYIKGELSQEVLRHLRWMLQKDLLGQDMFLIGRPGPLRRQLAMQFLEMTARELEYVSLSRDTTESDLKQRREIKGGTAKYFDQCAVRAAVEGRILILEGIEKAERNVLPVLNNLLENREMHLEDGRFLIPAKRYDKLLEEHSREDLDRWHLVRVSEDFRVIALGLPVPRYFGNPLDPPLRSRFQARDVNSPSFKEQLDELRSLAPELNPAQVSQLLSCCHALLSPESSSLGLPDFPADSLPAAIKLLDSVPGLSGYDALYRLYPYQSFLGREGQEAVESVLNNFQLLRGKDQPPPRLSLQDVVPEKSIGNAQVRVTCETQDTALKVPCGSGERSSSTSRYVPTAYQERLLVELMLSHQLGDMCIIGPRGCGKSATVQRLADLLNYQVEPIVLYQDMTSRDLIQQRTTLPSGDTVWKNSPLVTAALEGKLAILDGIHRIHPSTLSIIHRLVHDRELQLHDGRRLVRHDRYDDCKMQYKLVDQQMEDLGILRIHPAFRIVALAEPPVQGSSLTQWLSSEMLSLFLFHEMRPLAMQEEMEIVNHLFGQTDNSFPKVMEIAHQMRDSEDPTLRSLSSSLSTRQLLRIARRMASYPADNPADIIHRACLTRFLPTLARQALDNVLTNAGIDSQLTQHEPVSPVCRVDGDILTIGKTTTQRYQTCHKTKVPDILFYDVPQHVTTLEWLLQDFCLGEHLLLVGNQGVGKNKLADRLLQLLNRPREYIQLHRDTTVQTLTLQPTVRDGVVIYEDSPLVQAVKHGHVLVVDEADKAPTHVTCILKTLVESGEMILSDGRRIVPHSDPRLKTTTSQIIPMHPDFRMIVLANRPGFPFLGNDFFGALGDLFSCHAVDNPSPESELSLLKQYGPDVPDKIVRRLVKAFGELRNMADQGLVQYPYSTREVVNIVKHLQEFPNEGISNVVGNVFDFDSYTPEVQETLIQTLHKHGIPIRGNPANVNLAKEISLPSVQLVAEWTITHPSPPVQLAVEERFLKTKPPLALRRQQHPLDRVEARAATFSEMQSYWTIPMPESSIVVALAAGKSAENDQLKDWIHVLTSNPLRLYTMQPYSDKIQELSLQGLISPLRGSRPSFTLAPLVSDGSSLLVHEDTSNTLLLVNTSAGKVHPIPLLSTLEQATGSLVQTFQLGSSKKGWSMLPSLLGQTNQVVLFEHGGSKIDVIDIEAMKAYSTSLPSSIKTINIASAGKWLVEDTDNRKYVLSKSVPTDPCPSLLLPVEESGSSGPKLNHLAACDLSGLPPGALSQSLGQKMDVPNRILSSEYYSAILAVGFPDLELSKNEIFAWPRPQGRSTKDSLGKTIILADCGQILRPVQTSHVPSEVLAPDNKVKSDVAAYLEVTDLLNHKLRYIPIPQPLTISPLTAWLYSNNELPVLLAPTSNYGIVTADPSGCVRLWETEVVNLEKSLIEWRQMIGTSDREYLQMTVDRPSGLDVTAPKHGKVDETGDPHVGGNTWAGGTGGRDTAGLGGKGGPYRLDAGHKVHQVSQEEKDAVPEHVKKAAREMAQKAFKQRLKEIQMSDYDAQLYGQFSDAVNKQVQALRVILGNLQAKSKERQWLRHQTAGELDDTKLIEGLTGEKTIYRRRAEKEPELGSPQTKPKRLKLVVDVSGSMYRFNSYDGRLDRELEAVIMVMEAFQGHEAQIQYDIVGHSGEDHHLEFVNHKSPPVNNKQRLDIIKTMHAHSQFCMSGDHTLAATHHAITTLSREDCDEAIIIVLSDANLERYGIAPENFAKILTSDKNVSAYAIFIGSLGDQADRLTKKLPAGRAFVCLDLKNIPQILQQIFAASVLNTR